MPLPPFQLAVNQHRAQLERFLAATVGPDDAQDCLQETLIAALRAYPRLRRDSNVRAWLFTLARNKALDEHRARGRRAGPGGGAGSGGGGGGGGGAAGGGGGGGRGGAPEAGGPVGEADSGGAVAVADGPDEELWAAVRGLPPKQRAAVVLRFVNDFSHREVAAVLDCSEEAARRSLHEGLARLRREMG